LIAGDIAYFYDYLKLLIPGRLISKNWR